MSTILARIKGLMHKFHLGRTKRQDTAYIVSNTQWEQGNDEQEQQDPPESQILHKFLPRGAEAGQYPITMVQMRIKKWMILHGTA